MRSGENIEDIEKDKKDIMECPERSGHSRKEEDMPIRIQNDIPVKEILERENLFVVDENRAAHQDIRPLEICILNLMPTKEETQIRRSDHHRSSCRKNGI